MINYADMEEIEYGVKTRRRGASDIVASEEHTFYLPPTREQKAVSGYHRADGPAIIIRNPSNGIATTEHYFVFGQLSRHDGPASFKRDARTAVVTQEDYAVDGAYHRVDGPARIERDPTSGKVLSESYYHRGKPHREDGPSFVLYDERGNVLRADYFLDGKEINRSEFVARRQFKGHSVRASAQWHTSANETKSNPTRRRNRHNSHPAVSIKN